MKTLKKLMALVMTAAVVMSMTVPSMAADNNTLTITGTSNTTYTIYKLFDVQEEASGYTYQLPDEWDGFATHDKVGNYISVVNDFVMWKKNTVSDADGAALAQLAKEFLTEKNTTSPGTILSADTVTVGGTISNLPDGYYLLVPDNNTACGVVLLAGGAPRSITEKTAVEGLPNVEKKVQEDSTNTYGSRNTVDIGQTINFQTTINAAVGASNYILHDKMDEHFTFTGITSVKRDGNDVLASDYAVDPDPSDECTFHIEFTADFCSSLADDAKIIVDYTAKLEKPGSTGEDNFTATSHPNTTWLTHTDTNVPTLEKTTTTETYKVVITKVDQDENPLDGAGFKLRDNVGRYFKAEVDGTVSWVELGEAAELFSGPDGKLEFYGVDAENFTVVETTVPGGYTGTTDVGASTKNSSAPTDPTIGENEAITIENILGTALPETGGIGTAIFYVVGALLVSAAGILLVAKRRMAK